MEKIILMMLGGFLRLKIPSRLETLFFLRILNRRDHYFSIGDGMFLALTKLPIFFGVISVSRGAWRPRTKWH